MANLFFTKQICTEQHCLLGITSDVIFVGGVDFFYSSVAEGQFSHPVHASSHACGQTEIGTGRCCVETVSAEVICTEMKTKEERMSTRCTKNRCQDMALFVLTVYQCCTLDPGRCHRRTHRRYVPGHIPGTYTTYMLSNQIHTLFTQNLAKGQHIFQVIFPLETTYLFRNLRFGWTPQRQSPSP